MALARDLRLPVVVTNDVHYATPEGREFQDVLTAIRHGRTLETLADLRRPDGESYVKSEAELLALPPGDGSLGRDVARAWAEGIEGSAALAASCSVDLGFEQYRFPGFPVPPGETPFSYLSELCWAGARKRYHPLTSAVVTRLAHELDVIERAGLAEFFLICWDLMRYAKEQGIPAQGRGSATSSIVSYTLGISRVEPIKHNLLFERFINEGRTTYPDVDIDFSSARREEVIQYIYGRYGPDHTGMVCNLVTYRARSAVREVGYSLGFPRPLVDRVAKALETYDSVMVRRDLEADGGFAEFFRRPGEGLPAEAGAAREAEVRGFVDGMGQLNVKSGAVGEELVDGLGRLNTRLPLVGKVPPWKQPPKPADPNAPRPFGWLHDEAVAAEAGALPAPISLGPKPPAQEGPQVGSDGAVRAGGSADEAPSATARPGSFGGSEIGRSKSPPVPLGAAIRALEAIKALRRPTIVRGTTLARPLRTPKTLILPVGAESGRRSRGCGRARPSRRPRSGPVAGTTTRAGPATRRRASPGCDPAGGRATPWTATSSSRRRSSRGGRSTRRAACPSRHRARPTASAGRITGTRRRPGRRRWAEAARARSPASSPSHRRSRSAGRRSTSPTGTAGSSSAPGSTASRATSRSTRAGCS